MSEEYVIDQFRKPVGSNLVASTLSGDEFKLDSIIAEIKSNDRFSTIVDLGCGRGRYCHYLADNGFVNVIGVDPVVEFLPKTENLSNLTFLVGSASSIPLNSDSVNVIFLSEVIQHIPNIETCLNEVRRVLKPNGQVIIFDRNLNSLHTKYLVPMRVWKFYKEQTGSWMYDRHGAFQEKWYSKKELCAMLAHYGFMNIDHKYILHDGKSKALFQYFPRFFWPYSLWTAEK
jgi:ubiquinone/menaquinone biosynthesis C-methylase UbiE